MIVFTISISKLCHDKKYYVAFDDCCVFVKDCRTHEVVAEEQTIDGLYRLHFEDGKTLMVNLVGSTMDLWHHCFGHTNKDLTKLTVDTFHLPACKKTIKQCATCVMG